MPPEANDWQLMTSKDQDPYFLSMSLDQSIAWTDVFQGKLDLAMAMFGSPLTQKLLQTSFEGQDNCIAILL